MNGYIRLFRKFISWEWYKNQNTKAVFIHCLLKANWEDGSFEGQIIKRGSFVTGRKKLSEELGLTEQQIRTALKHLISTNEITIEKTNKYSIITIINYDLYQDINQEVNQQLTNNQPTINQQLTTNEKEKEEKKEKEYIKENIKRKVFKKPTIKEIADYCKERKNNVNAEVFYNFYESKDWLVGKNKMKNWKACVRSWELRNKSKNEKLPEWFEKKVTGDKLNTEEESELREIVKAYE